MHHELSAMCVNSLSCGSRPGGDDVGADASQEMVAPERRMDTRTLKVFQRREITPVEVGELATPVATAAEAAALERAEADRDQSCRAKRFGDHASPAVGGDQPNPNATHLERVFEAGGGTIGGYNNFWIAAGSLVVSLNGEKRSSIIVDPADGRVPRMKPEAAQRNTEYLRRAVSPDASEGSEAGPASAYDDPERRPLAERCLLGFGSTSGPPTLPNYFYNNLKQIVQTRIDHDS